MRSTPRPNDNAPITIDRAAADPSRLALVRGAVVRDDMPHYDAGRHWSHLLLSALTASHDGAAGAASALYAEADALLGPVGDLTSTSDLKDFIAGAARTLDDAIASQGRA